MTILIAALYALMVASLIGDAAIAALIAGTFGLLNTILNWHIIRTQRQVKEDLNGTTEDVHTVAGVIKMREGDLTTAPSPSSSKQARRAEDREGN